MTPLTLGTRSMQIESTLDPFFDNGDANSSGNNDCDCDEFSEVDMYS